jgi:hypothetical protein
MVASIGSPYGGLNGCVASVGIPATRNGQPVDTTTTITISFQLA